MDKHGRIGDLHCCNLQLSGLQQLDVSLVCAFQYWRLSAEIMRWLVHRRTFIQLLKYILVIITLIIVVLRTTFESHIIVTHYRRSWVQSEIEALEPLSRCFDPFYISREYNLSKALGPKFTEIQAGRPVAKGMDCYNYAGTVQMSEEHRSEWRRELNGERINYHTYWRTDLAPFAERQEYVLKSFFATQDIAYSRLIIWSNGDLSSNRLIQKWLFMYPEELEVRVASLKELTRGTSLEKSSRVKMMDERAWVDGDLIRLLVLWHYGGVWVDMDQLLTRDMSPLFEHEFVTQWDCFERPYQALNGAIMHFYKHSPYLCEFFHIMSSPNSPPPRPSSTDWGAILYLKAWRRLINEGVRPFKIIPWCFTDGRDCSDNVMLPDPFTSGWGRWGKWGSAIGVSRWSREDTSEGQLEDPHDQSMVDGEGGKLDRTLSKIFAVHLHNQWEKNFPKGGWVDNLLLKRYDKKLGMGLSDAS